MDYYQIGQRIRERRKQLGLSQEELAEAAGISVTHMSHIETGSTKLSLPVLVTLAKKLDSPVDALLSARQSTGKQAVLSSITDELNLCTENELLLICEVVRTIRASVRKNALLKS